MTNKYNQSIYNSEWLDKRVRYHDTIDKLTNLMVKELGPFESSLDLGAGDGWYSYILSLLGTDAYAVDFHKWELPQMPVNEVNCITHDLRKPLNLNRKFDLVMCIEVAEHLPETSADILCDTIVNHCDNLLVFTAAPPGQTGDGHINCQPKEYWDRQLTERGLIYQPGKTEHIKGNWEHILGNKMWWLYTNIMIYKKEK